MVKKRNYSINNQATYLFFLSNKFIDFPKSKSFSTFLRLCNHRFLEKNKNHNLSTFLVYDIESYYKNISKIRNVTFTFENFQTNFPKRKKIEQIHEDPEESINSSEIKENG